MKFKFFLPVLILLCSCLPATAQVCIPEQAEAFWVKAMNEIKPAHVDWVKATAKDIRSGKTEIDDVEKLATNYGQLLKLADGDITALVLLVMMEASKSAQEDLKAIMAGIKAMHEKKKALRETLNHLKKKKSEKKTLSREAYDSLKKVLANADPDSAKKLHATPQPVKPSRTITAAELNELIDEYRDKLDSMNEMGEMQSLRLQMLMDRMNKMMTALANMLKKIGDTQSQVISNLK